MRTETISIYKFSELSDEAKKRVIYEQREFLQREDFWGSERLQSYRKAEEIYDELHRIDGIISGARLVAWIQNNLSHYWERKNWISKHTDVEIANSDWKYKYDCTKKKISRVFSTNNLENCPLTGVCYDYDFLKPIIDFMRKPSAKIDNTDLQIPDYETIAERDMEFDDDYVIESIEANEYEFNEDGTIY